MKPINNPVITTDKKREINSNQILTLISEPVIFEQLAEEAAELAHAALKYARILRDENPTPVTPEKGYANVIEEYSDVILCARTLNIIPCQALMDSKYQRWINRIFERRYHE